MNTNNTMIPYLFGESTIRFHKIQDTIVIVAKDVCEFLSISKYRDAVAKLEPDERVSITVDTLGGPQEMTGITESGLYALVFMSRKPEARAFRKWVTTEVLPAIRRKGFYSQRQHALTHFLRELLDMGLDSKDATKLCLASFPPLTRKESLLEAAEVQNREAAEDPDGALFLSIMAPGVEYRVNDFFECLPPGHRILKIKAPKGRHTAIGMVMERLVRTGKLRRINARYATFALASAKIVPITGNP